MVENVRLLEQAGLPSVMVNMPEMAGAANQVILRETAETSPIRYLLSQGHRRFIVMVGRDNTPDTDECIRHTGEVAAEYGVDVPEENILFGDYESTVSRSAMLNRLSVDREFTAVYSLSDTMAMGVYDALSEVGLQVPADVSVIGRNDSSFSQLLSPPLTTVHRPLFMAGEKAAEVLLQSMDSGRKGIKLYLDGSLIVRGSTRVHHEG
jgi:LacI family transcriptional regulator